MLAGLFGAVSVLLLPLCLIAPFTFVYCLIYAIRAAVSGHGNEIALGAGAGVSLLILLVAVVVVLA